MRSRSAATAIAIVFSALMLHCQDTWYGGVSGMHFMYNPAYTGSAGNPVMQLSCFSFLPGNGFGLRSVYASFDGYFEPLHGGAGVWVSDDIHGEVINDFRTGASYAYHLKADRDLFFNAGLTASLVYRGINNGAVILPADIDPFNGPGSSSYAADGNMIFFDVGTGLAFSKGQWYGGLSVMHLTQPWLSRDQQGKNRLARLYTFTAGVSLTRPGSDFTLNPSAAFLLQYENMTVYAGAEAVYRNLMCGLALWHVNNGFLSAAPSLGWMMGSAKILLSYSYVLSGGDSAFRGAAVVRAGLSVSFRNVEKSKAIHIIKLPCL